MQVQQHSITDLNKASMALSAASKVYECRVDSFCEIANRMLTQIPVSKGRFLNAELCGVVGYVLTNLSP